ncbi:helix-turn-helix domain-containing protein [Pedobacter nyackensis]|uniref:Helix-turn-helix n=1 Tax=Pedobacter nyackensis TaxID=475255 RepID=A0A1W2AHN3_9SPHI|nr:helix-turn-helix transcriptional regulator [Pedobacter nyackensis]SMC60215.1 Helix-turn-helix [Pedobacter nyackensis]
MDSQLGLKKIIEKGLLNSELELERASIMYRRLRLFVKDHPEFIEQKKMLQDIIMAYEDKHWVKAEITTQQVEENDLAELIAERENKFTMHRKQLITSKLKEKKLTQKQLGMILGHTSETYMSELINGIESFTLNDLTTIHKLLNISMQDLEFKSLDRFNIS